MALPEMKVMGLGTPGNDKIRSFFMDDLLTGKPRFVGDRHFAGQLYAVAKHATVDHANIVKIDASEALKVPGVVKVLTYDTNPEWARSAPILYKTVPFYGAPIALIIATDWYIAQRAVNLVKVEYEVLPAVIKTTDVMADDEAMTRNTSAPLSGRFADSNFQSSGVTNRGDVDAALKNAAYTRTISDMPWTTRYQHQPLEQYEALAYWSGDEVYVYIASQNIHGHHRSLHNWTGIPLNKLHVYTPGCGGGLGTRLNNPEALMAVFASKEVDGRPVLYKCTKKHSMLFGGRQFDARSVITVGCDNDGKLVALDVKYVCNGYGAGITPIFSKTLTIPNMRYEGTRLYLNDQDRCAWRCVNDPPTGYHFTHALDLVAEDFNMRPDEFRLKNIMGEHDVDQDSGLPFGTKEVNACLDKVLQESGFASKWHKPGTKKLADGRLHGIGVHCHHDSHGRIAGSDRATIVLMLQDGTAAVLDGGSAPHNQMTEMAIVAAEVLGLKIEDVKTPVYGNSDATLNGGMHGGSSFTGSTGGATMKAAEQCRKQVFEAACKNATFSAVNAKPEDLDSKDSVIFLKRDPSVKATFAAICSSALNPIGGIGHGWNNVDADGTGGLQRPKDGFEVGHNTEMGSACADVCEVAVDPETGEVEILEHWNAVGTGRVIYTDGVLQQMGSGTELQINMALFYGDIKDIPTGNVIGSQYTESQMMTTLDCNPSRYHLYPIEGDNHTGPLGAHGIGEPCVGGYSCILSAIYNAIGKWVDTDHGACNPDRVLKALGKA